jgi:uncharacterized protein YndB with AHSA1/START domain
MAKKRELEFEFSADAKPEDLSYAFTTAQGWRDWLCDASRFEARPGGSYQLAWSSGWYAAGNVESLNKGERVQLSWRGKGDPGTTKITLTFEETEGGATVRLTHIGFGEGEAWDRSLQEAQKGWEMGFENLESIFTTGEDLREIRRPMLGIMLNDFSERIAEELGVPVTKGLRIDRPIEGMGAEKAGLQSNDVIVEMDGKPIHSFPDLDVVLQAKQAGDPLSVGFYRGAKRQQLEIKLSARPTADVPMDPAAIAKELQPIYEGIAADLRELFAGVSEAEAEHRPAPGEWSAKENMAHLILSLQWWRSWITELMQDAERPFEGEGENLQAEIDALLAVTPDIADLLDRFERAQVQSLALIATAEPLKARKGVLWRMGQALLQFPDSHERGHMEQMRAAIEAAGA